MSQSQVKTSSWVQKTPGVCGGDACVRHTRHTVAGLVQWRKLGLTDARILEHHPDLSQDDLEAAWTYYASNCAEIDQAIRDDEDAAGLPRLPENWASIAQFG